MTHLDGTNERSVAFQGRRRSPPIPKRFSG